MSFLEDARSLTPKNKIVLVEVDGTEFGAGITRMHYCPMPHSAAEILDAANMLYGRDELQAKASARNGSIAKTDLGIKLTSSADDSSVVLTAINQPGSAYSAIRIKARWIIKPESPGYQVYFRNASHDFGAGVAAGSVADVTTDSGEGWVQLDIPMSGVGDWSSSTITAIRLDLWQSGAGAIEIREVALIGANQENIDGDKLMPKSIWWNGLEFGYWPFIAEGIEFSSEQQSSPTLSVANLSGVVSAMLRAFEQMVDAKVTIIQTTVEYLDARNFPTGNDSADPNEAWIQTYYIDRPDYDGDDYVKFILSSPLDLQGLQIPTRQITGFCMWQARGLYAKGLDIEEENGCDWNLNRAGIKYYDKDGNEVADPSKDVCGGCVKDCRLRFGQLYSDPKAAKLPFGGFPASNLLSN